MGAGFSNESLRSHVTDTHISLLRANNMYAQQSKEHLRVFLKKKKAAQWKSEEEGQAAPRREFRDSLMRN